MSKFKILCVNIFDDNYVWIISNVENNLCVIVDPGEFSSVSKFLSENRLIPIGILITHHHKDHCGGLDEIKQNHNIPIYGYINSNVDGITHYIDDGDKIFFPQGNMLFNIIKLTGHTLDHVGYIFEDMVFCGDTLFSGGCGKIFEGSYEQMFYSLNKLRSLDNETKIYCSHEYTLSNLIFALSIDRDNQFLINYFDKVKKMRFIGESTVPSTIFIEKKINPFFRCDNQGFIESVKKYKNISFNTSFELFTYLRDLKNSFKANI